jgi:DMSO/TMAO reductase YedYZ molybdopterin-dependent catalytic subunit
MLESLKPRGGKRWPRGQKFVLSTTGIEADAAYRDAVQSARAQGRNALDAAQRTWAEPHRIAPADGVVLGELRSGRKSIAEIAKGLDDCGTSPAEVKAAVDRLTDAGLVEPVPASTQAAA